VVGVFLIILALAGCTRSPEAKSAAFIEAGKKLLEKKDPGRAILQFRNAAQATPKNAEIYYQIALASLQTGDYGQAASALRKALDLNPKHQGAQLQLSRLLVDTNDPELIQQARGRLEDLLRDSPVNIKALRVLALSDLKLGSLGDAAQHLQEALANAPQDLVTAVLLAQTKMGQNEFKSAEAVLKKAVDGSPKSGTAAIMLGQFYAGLRRYPEAEREFRRAVSLDPKGGAPLINLGLLLTITGQKQAAEQTFKQLTGFQDPEIASYYALFLFQEGRNADAIREFQSIMKANPADRQARTRLVTAYNTVNRRPEAQKVLEEALKKNPKDLDALLQRAEILVADGKYDLAETDVNRVLQLSPNSAEVHYVVARLHLARGQQLRYRADLVKALQINPYLLPARLELSQALISANQGTAALDTLNQAPESQRDTLPAVVQRNWAYWILRDLAAMRKGIDKGLSLDRSAELLIQDGVWKLGSGNPTGGRAALEEALKLNPSDVRALGALQASYALQKQDAMAVAKVKEYAAKQPTSAPVQNFLGSVLLVSGDRQLARTAFHAAIAADPTYLKADLGLIQVDLAERKWDDARKKLTAILSVGEEPTARFWLGTVEQANGNNELALGHYRKAVEGDPQNPVALNNLAYLVLTTGKNPDEALKYAQKAAEMAPDDPDTNDTLGWVLYNKGSYAMAVRHLEVAAKGRKAVPKFHLAMAYAKAGDAAKGRATLSEALKLNNKIAEAKEAQELLAR
jgi:tetratricopeptide (TPR) repeat protein